MVKALPDAERDRFGEIVFRFFFGTLNYLRRAAGDPHPGNYLYLEDGRVGFLDFGLMRVVDADYLAGERRLAQAIMRDDAVAVKDGLATLGYLPNPDEFEPEGLLGQLRMAATWYLEPGFRRLTSADIAEVIEEGSSPRSPYFAQMRRQTIPPQALLIRRMEGLVFATLGDLRAGADWHALGAEYWGDGPPSTPLGEQDSAFGLGCPSERRSDTFSLARVGPRGCFASHARHRSRLSRPASRPAHAHRGRRQAGHEDPDPAPLVARDAGDQEALRRRRRRASRYSIAVSTVKDCSANACAVASFSAMKGIAVYGDRKVTLAKGRKGRYIPLSCGGSCSPPSVVWKERGVVYEISTDATRAQLVRMANSAIRKGPR